MAIIFQDGQVGTNQETAGDFSAWTGTLVSPQVVASNPHHGVNSFLTNQDGDKFYIDLASANALYARCYLRWNVNPAAAETYGISGTPLLGLHSNNTGSAGLAGVLIINDGGTIKWQINIKDNTLAYQTFTAPTPNPTINQYYCVDIYFSRNTLSGAILWVDGVLLLQPAITTANLAIESMSFNQNTSGASNPNINSDCFVVDNANYIGPETTAVIHRLLRNAGL